MKIIILLCFLLSLPIVATNAENINFGWTLGTVWGYYDALSNRGNTDIDILHFNWLLYNRFIIGFDLVSAKASANNDNTIRYAVLPLEVAYIPWSYNMNANHQLCFSINGKAGLYLISHEDNDRFDRNFYGSIGGQLFLQFRHPSYRSSYSRYLSLFVEYNNFKELKAGIGIDLTAIVLLLLLIGN